MPFEKKAALALEVNESAENSESYIEIWLGRLTLACFKAGVALANDVHFAFSADNLAVAVSFFCSFQG